MATDDAEDSDEGGGTVEIVRSHSREQQVGNEVIEGRCTRWLVSCYTAGAALGGWFIICCADFGSVWPTGTTELQADYETTQEFACALLTSALAVSFFLAAGLTSTGSSRRWVLTAHLVLLMGCTCWLALQLVARMNGAIRSSQLAAGICTLWMLSCTAMGQFILWHRVGSDSFVRQLNDTKEPTCAVLPVESDMRLSDADDVLKDSSGGSRRQSTGIATKPMDLSSICDLSEEAGNRDTANVGWQCNWDLPRSQCDRDNSDSQRNGVPRLLGQMKPWAAKRAPKGAISRSGTLVLGSGSAQPPLPGLGVEKALARPLSVFAGISSPSAPAQPPPLLAWQQESEAIASSTAGWQRQSGDEAVPLHHPEPRRKSPDMEIEDVSDSSSDDGTEPISPVSPASANVGVQRLSVQIPPLSSSQAIAGKVLGKAEDCSSGKEQSRPVEKPVAASKCERLQGPLLLLPGLQLPSSWHLAPSVLENDSPGDEEGKGTTAEVQMQNATNEARPIDEARLTEAFIANLRRRRGGFGEPVSAARLEEIYEILVQEDGGSEALDTKWTSEALPSMFDNDSDDEIDSQAVLSQLDTGNLSITAFNQLREEMQMARAGGLSALLASCQRSQAASRLDSRRNSVIQSRTLSMCPSPRANAVGSASASRAASRRNSVMGSGLPCPGSASASRAASRRNSVIASGISEMPQRAASRKASISGVPLRSASQRHSLAVPAAGSNFSGQNLLSTPCGPGEKDASRSHGERLLESKQLDVESSGASASSAVEIPQSAIGGETPNVAAEVTALRLAIASAPSTATLRDVLLSGTGSLGDCCLESLLCATSHDDGARTPEGLEGILESNDDEEASDAASGRDSQAPGAEAADADDDYELGDDAYSEEDDAFNEQESSRTAFELQDTLSMLPVAALESILDPSMVNQVMKMLLMLNKGLSDRRGCNCPPQGPHTCMSPVASMLSSQIQSLQHSLAHSLCASVSGSLSGSRLQSRRASTDYEPSAGQRRSRKSLQAKSGLAEDVTLLAQDTSHSPIPMLQATRSSPSSACSSGAGVGSCTAPSGEEEDFRTPVANTLQGFASLPMGLMTPGCGPVRMKKKPSSLTLPRQLSIVTPVPEEKEQDVIAEQRQQRRCQSGVAAADMGAG